MIDVNECHVWWARPRPVLDTERELLSADERTRMMRYRRQEDRSRFLTGRVLLRVVVGGYLGVPPASVGLDATCRHCGGPHGKPRLLTPASRLRFSLSHSGDLVALAVTAGVSVGIDVEKIGALPPDPALVAAALAESERLVLDSLPEAEQVRAFTTYWTRKEAVLKADGKGLTAGPDCLVVSAPAEPPQVLQPATSPPVLGPVRLYDLHADPQYGASVALLTATTHVVRERWWSDHEIDTGARETGNRTHRRALSSRDP
ncbi:MAG: 4'-phosphopantetheinyl transferase superfamily protein [Actinobacteria bacterium]|nr:4'-phosphopantetheinyl transferase superfamily protein [Actinomycetota bacterium]